MKRRLLMIGLDGVELSILEPMIAAGRLPTIKRIRDEGAAVSLQHGAARRTGLAWEHVSTGLSPEDALRWSAIDFDAQTYRVSQKPTRHLPFLAPLDLNTVVFDAPYFDLARAPAVRGMVNWGAHDPGVAEIARPASLARGLHDRFGEYAAKEWIYGFVWPSAERTERMGQGLEQAVVQRFRASEWLFGERFQDWQLGIMVAGEFHSAAEALWHGVDPDHPLAAHPSAAAARTALERVYEAADAGLARLRERLSDVVFMLFNLHGMGPNNSDVTSLVLLPELLFRHSFGRSLLKSGKWPLNDAGAPLLGADEDWHDAVINRMGLRVRARRRIGGMADRVRREILRRPARESLRWMPAFHYQPYWRQMQAFALPSYYDGRIRVNLKGREAGGRVALDDYDRACDELEALLRACKDVATGKDAVASIERNPGAPLERSPSDADLFILWNGGVLGVSHPELGTLGPLPYRRTGGHTGGDGFAWLSGPGILNATLPPRSAFDVVPTALGLLGAESDIISGHSFAEAVA